MRNIIDVCNQLIQIVNEKFPDYRKLIINNMKSTDVFYEYLIDHCFHTN